MSHVVTAKLYDLASNELADISGIALEKKLQRRANQGRGFVITAPAAHSLLTTVAGDGYANLRRGNRKLLVWEDDTMIFHGRVFATERAGDGRQNLVTITALSPWMELGYEADDRAGRIVRDSTGNFIDPTFTSSVVGQDEISGPDLIWQILHNSQQTGTESDPNPGEGPLPIFLSTDPDDPTTGPFDLTVPPAIDLSPVDSMTWPMFVGDFIQQLIDTGVVDVDMRPVDPAEGLDPFVMVALEARSRLGSDRTATVHFDYWTGSKNVGACRVVDDFATINNKLYDYLGPRRDIAHWRGNITPGSPGTLVDPTASRTLYGSEFMSIRVFDSIGDENAHRPLYIALWNAEQGERVEPRQMLFMTPNPDVKALFEPPADYDVFDSVSTNVGAALGIPLAEAQRVMGYDKEWDRQGVARISELITTADAE